MVRSVTVNILELLIQNHRIENGFMRHEVKTSSIQISSLKNGNKTVSIRSGDDILIYEMTPAECRLFASILNDNKEEEETPCQSTL